MNPLPTPFDIAELPYFPPEPGIAVWCSVLLVFALLIAAAFIPRRSKRRLSSADYFPFREAEGAIKKLAASKSLKKEDLFELSRKLKTVVHAYEECDLSSLGPAALTRLKPAEQKPILAKYLSLLAEIERAKYSSRIEESHMRRMLSDTLASLLEYRQMVRASLEEEQNAAAAK